MDLVFVCIFYLSWPLDNFLSNDLYNYYYEMFYIINYYNSCVYFSIH